MSATTNNKMIQRIGYTIGSYSYKKLCDTKKEIDKMLKIAKETKK